jgi:IclR family transcriptional regulator, acetate operon repressor
MANVSAEVETTLEGRSPRYPVNSVSNAAKLLELLEHSHELRLSDVADALDVSRSAAHRLLTTLEAGGFLSQNATTRCYEPGAGLLKLANALTAGESRWSFARPYMAALSERVGETVNLILRQSTQVSFAESIEATSTVRVGSRLGVVMPAHSTSGGKVLLAALPEDEVLKLYPDGSISHPLGGRTVSRKALIAELRRTAKRGFGTNFGETEAGISGIAVPVTIEKGSVFALAVAVPSGKVPSPRVNELVTELLTTAEALVASMDGYSR